MTIHLLEDRRDSSDNEPISREVLLRMINGDLWIVLLDAYGSNRFRCVGHVSSHDLYPDDALLRQLAETLTAWFHDRDEWQAIQDAKLAEQRTNTRCPDTHGALEYQESCPTCGWTNEIPF